jgi:hypothetical protein
MWKKLKKKVSGLLYWKKVFGLAVGIVLGWALLQAAKWAVKCWL